MERHHMHKLSAERGRSSLAVVGCGLQQKRSASQAILCIVFLQFDKDLTPSLKRPPPAITLHLDTMMTYDDHRRIWPVHRVDCWWSIIPASSSAKRSCPQLRLISKVRPHFTLQPSALHCFLSRGKSRWKYRCASPGWRTQARGKPREWLIQHSWKNSTTYN